MTYIICPICQREIKARSNARLAFRYHLENIHSKINQQDQAKILSAAKPHHREHRALIGKGLPIGLRVLLQRQEGYEHTLEIMTQCCKAHSDCPYIEQCKQQYDIRCNCDKKWPLDGDSPANHRAKQLPVPIEVIIPRASHEEILGALERQLIMV